MSATHDPPRASQSFIEKGGEAWARLQEQTDALIDPLGRLAIERLAPALGERIVDVGCGCGQTLLELAELVGDAGRVVGVDISPPMLARARECIAGRPSVSVVLADAQTHTFEPGSFDALFSRFGVMFFDDARAAFANLHRAVRPGGRLSFVCWQPMAKNSWAEIPLKAVMRLLPPSALPEMLREGRPGPFFFSDPDRLRAILADAGWTDVAFESIERELHVAAAATLEEAVAYSFQIGPAARAMGDVPEALRPELETALREALRPFAGPRGVWMPGAAFVVQARRA